MLDARPPRWTATVRNTTWTLSAGSGSRVELRSRSSSPDGRLAPFVYVRSPMLLEAFIVVRLLTHFPFRMSTIHPHERHDRSKAAAHPKRHLCPRLSRSARPPCYVPDIMSCPRHDVAPNYTKLHRRLMCVQPYGEVAFPRKATARVRVTRVISCVRPYSERGLLGDLSAI